MAEGRVGGQRLQQRQVAPQAVEHSDRRIGVRHPDVDVQSADRCGDRIAQQLADALVTLLVSDLRLALDGRGMRPGPEQPRPRLEDRPAQAA